MKEWKGTKETPKVEEIEPGYFAFSTNYWWRFAKFYTHELIKGEGEAHIELFTDALHTVQETGMMPSELANELVKEKIEVANVESKVTADLKQKDEEIENFKKFIIHELKEIPKHKDFASSHGDSRGYACVCGQEVLLNRIIKHFGLAHLI